MKYLGIAVIVGTVVTAMIFADGFDILTDTMALIVVVGIGIGHALGAKDGESAKLVLVTAVFVADGWVY